MSCLLYFNKMNIPEMSVNLSLKSLARILSMLCCSGRFEQLSSRNAKRLARRGLRGGHGLLRGLWNNEQRPSGGRKSGHGRLHSVHSAIPLRHCSELRRVSRKTLHRGSRRVRHRWVCINARIAVGVLRFGVCLWSCTGLLRFTVKTNIRVSEVEIYIARLTDWNGHIIKSTEKTTYSLKQS